MNKKELKNKYKEIFNIVKQSIDKWDCIGLLDMGAPKCEYDIETTEIVVLAGRTSDVDELAKHIEKVFVDYFWADTYKASYKEASSVAEEIIGKLEFSIPSKIKTKSPTYQPT